MIKLLEQTDEKSTVQYILIIWRQREGYGGPVCGLMFLFYFYLYFICIKI